MSAPDLPIRPLVLYLAGENTVLHTGLAYIIMVPSLTSFHTPYVQIISKLCQLFFQNLSKSIHI